MSGSKVVVIYLWGHDSESVGTVRVEVYSPHGCPSAWIGSDVSSLVPPGERWGQDNILPSLQSEVEEATRQAFPDLTSFAWKGRVLTAHCPALQATSEKVLALQAELRTVQAEQAKVSTVRAVGGVLAALVSVANDSWNVDGDKRGGQ